MSHGDAIGEDRFIEGVSRDPSLTPIAAVPDENKSLPHRTMDNACRIVAPHDDDPRATSMMMAVYYDRENKVYRSVEGFQGDIQLVMGACEMFLRLANDLLEQAESESRIIMAEVQKK